MIQRTFSLKFTVAAGFNLSRFGLGFSIDRYMFNLDLGPFWFGIEF